MNERGIAINITKVQKLSYIVYGMYLLVTGKRLTDEHPQAWPFGPVFPKMRKKLCRSDFNRFSLKDKGLEDIQNDSVLQRIMVFVYNTFGDWTASELVAWSHKEGSPWEATIGSPCKVVWGREMEDSRILSYFKKIIKIHKPNEQQ
jgi:uncharacterized phage-associated protein